MPINRFPFTALLEHGAQESIVSVQGLVGEAVAVSNPAFINGFVFERKYPHDLVVLDLNNQISAGRVMRTDRLAARQLPSPGAVAKRFAGQRADRTKVNHVARQFGVDRHADKRFYLGMFTAVRHAQLHHTGHFLTETYTAGAVNAAAHFLHGYQRAHVLVEHRAFFFLIPRLARTITDRQILQLALAALITDRAIQRVIDQQKLHHALLSFDGFVVFGMHDHALRHRRSAGRHGLGRLFHIDQAHAAVGCDAEFLVIAKMRNIRPRLFSRMHYRAAFEHFHLLAVEFYFNHIFLFQSLKPAPQRHLLPELRL